jgi:hypothetical protein
MAPLLPAPDPNDSADPNDSTAEARPRKRRRGGPGGKIPNVDELLALLLQLNGLVAMRVMSTSQAGVIQRGLRAILDVQLKRTQGSQDVLPQEALAELCRQDSRVFDLLHPFLSDEQVNSLMGHFTDNAEEQT